MLYHVGRIEQRLLVTWRKDAEKMAQCQQESTDMGRDHRSLVGTEAQQALSSVPEPGSLSLHHQTK